MAIQTDKFKIGPVNVYLFESPMLPAPTALTAGVPTAGGGVTPGTHSYVVTYTAANGETIGGAASNVITAVLTTGQTVPLTAIPIGPAGTVARKIYRTVAGNAGNYLLLATIADNTTTTYSDTTADAGLGAAAPLTNTTAAYVNIGGTGPVELEVKSAWENALCEQLGTAPANSVCTGVEGKVTFAFREIILENFARACKAYVKTYHDTTRRRVELGANVGQDLRSIAQKIKLVPLVGGAETTDLEQIIVAEFAAPSANTIKIPFAAKGQREVAAEFTLLPDPAKANRLFFIGDDTATTVAAL